MCALASSDMPGHRVLHDRVTNALDTCVETQGVDFKQSAPWAALQYKLAKTAMAMGNLRDGGVVVIGVSDHGASWNLTGITQADLATYDVDVVVDAINRYASPPITVNLVTVEYDGKMFLALEVREFPDTPFVCKKDGPPQSGLERGMICVRPPGVAQTTRVRSADDLHDLLELAAEKRARAFIEMAHRVGFSAGAPAKPFDDELGGL